MEVETETYYLFNRIRSCLRNYFKNYLLQYEIENKVKNYLL